VSLTVTDLKAEQETLTRRRQTQKTKLQGILAVMQMLHNEA